MLPSDFLTSAGESPSDITAKIMEAMKKNNGVITRLIENRDSMDEKIFSNSLKELQFSLVDGIMAIQEYNKAFVLENVKILDPTNAEPSLNSLFSLIFESRSRFDQCLPERLEDVRQSIDYIGVYDFLVELVSDLNIFYQSLFTGTSYNLAHEIVMLKIMGNERESLIKELKASFQDEVDSWIEHKNPLPFAREAYDMIKPLCVDFEDIDPFWNGFANALDSIGIKKANGILYGKMRLYREIVADLPVISALGFSSGAYLRLFGDMLEDSWEIPLAMDQINSDRVRIVLALVLTKEKGVDVSYNSITDRYYIDCSSLLISIGNARGEMPERIEKYNEYLIENFIHGDPTIKSMYINAINEDLTYDLHRIYKWGVLLPASNSVLEAALSALKRRQLLRYRREKRILSLLGHIINKKQLSVNKKVFDHFMGLVRNIGGDGWPKCSCRWLADENFNEDNEILANISKYWNGIGFDFTEESEYLNTNIEFYTKYYYANRLRLALKTRHEYQKNATNLMKEDEPLWQ